MEMDKVKILKRSDDSKARETAFVSINGVELNTVTNYKIEKIYNERCKVTIELDADIEILNCGDMHQEQVKNFLRRASYEITNEIKVNTKPKVTIDKHPSFKNSLLTDSDYDLCKNKETGEIYAFKFESDVEPVRFKLISLSNIFDEQYVTLEHFRKNYKLIGYDSTRRYY